MAITRSRPPESPTKKTNGRRPRRRRHPFLRFLIGTFQVITIIVLAAIAGTSAGLYYVLSHLPSSVSAIENYRPLGRTLIYSSDGVLLANLFQQNRQIVTIDKIPKNLQNATVAIEDSRFYSSVGIDFRGIGRALWKDVSNKDLSQGGSTITQQLVRNLGIGGVNREKTISRKIREALFAIQIERNYSKQQILEMYLNQVYYGSGSYGVQAASQTYFGKSVDKLDLAECALLAGLPQRPVDYSPYTNKEGAKTRRDTVLARMRDLGYISAQQCTDAQNEPIKLISSKPPSGGSQVYHAPYFVDYVKKQLDNKFGSDFIERGGISVETTLNWMMQNEAEQDIRQGIADAKWSGATQGALVAMDPATGYIKAMVGGVDYNKSQFNIAADGRRQPGSSFKPVIYTAALDSGLISENTRILDGPISFPSGTGGWWSPKNDDGRYHGWQTAENAIAQSINVIAVKVLKEVGVSTAINYARMMGITSPLLPYYTLALGSSAVTPLEMADMYATIDNLGQRPIPMAITRVTDNAGNIIEDDEPQLESTGISRDALTQMSDMLRAVVTDGTAAASFRDDNPPDAHGKTGTTQSHLDVWFDGYTKKLVCVVWAGHPTVNAKGQPIYGVPMNHEAWGATIVTPIWKKFMVAALAIQAKDDAKYRVQPKPKVVSAPGTPAASTTGPASPAGANQPTTDNGTTPGDNSTNSTAGQPDPFAKPAQTTPNGSAPATSPADTGPTGNSPPSGSTPATSTQTNSNQGGTTTVWIDDATGLRAPPNAPGAHEQTFASGTEPTAYAPGYSGQQSNAPAPQNTAPPASATPPTPAPSAPVHRARSEPRMSEPPAPPKPHYVTVTICADSGLLATRWCPETIQRTYIAGQQPHRYCTIHKPPPGER